MSPKKLVVDREGLAELLRGTRRSRALRLEDVAEETGLTASTLSRLERVLVEPSLGTVRAVVDWIGIPLDRVVSSGPSPNAHQASTPLEEAELQFRADRDLAPEAAEALIGIMRTAYASLKKNRE